VNAKRYYGVGGTLSIPEDMAKLMDISERYGISFPA
jgi:hypothetical protein